MKLDYGTEEEFFKFINNLKDEDRVALISHTDLDGIASARVVDRSLNIAHIEFLNYGEIDQNLISRLKENKINKIIFTDLSIKEDFLDELEFFEKVLIIDHHPSSDLNREKIIFLKGESGYSAGYLCYYLFSKIKNIDKTDWIVACSCISDYCYFKPKEWLSIVFDKYGDTLEYFGESIRDSGKFWDLQHKISLGLIYFKKNLKKAYNLIGNNFGEIGELEKFSEEVQKEVEKNLEVFKNEKEEFEGGYFLILDPKFSVGSLVSNIISSREPTKSLIIARLDGKYYNISMRRHDGKFDCGKFLKETLEEFEDAQGGGHIPAAGGRFRREDLNKFREKIGLSKL